MSVMEIEKSRFLTDSKAFEIAEKFGTPCYVYSEEVLTAQAKAALAFPNAFGLTVRYAMKASSNKNILALFDSLGLHIDASSGYEVKRALKAGVAPQKISLSTQQIPSDIKELCALGINFNACSLYQLETYGKLLPNTQLGVRINPGLGSGGTNRTNVGGPASSFGIWHEYLDKIDEIASRCGLKIIRIHTHIGSGSDPAVWQKVAKMSLETVRRFKDVKILNMGGGFKVGRMASEVSTDLQKVGAPVAQEIKRFAEDSGRKLHFEIEPGTFLAANSACVLSNVQDMCDTGRGGYKFLKIDSGMTEVLRPSIYGAQHPISIIQRKPDAAIENYIVAGHCCESGDIITPAAGDPEGLSPRPMLKASIGDLCAIDGSGAYCSAMSTKNYNSYPAAPEIMLLKDGSLKLIRKAQTLDQVLQDEI